MHRAHEWFRRVSGEIQADYLRLHEAAARDPQKAGHGGEGTWARLLQDWLPASYGVATRKYILPERPDAEGFETDVVVFSPGYPERLRDQVEVLAGGVAAAFSVRLTLDAAGIDDAVRRAALLRRSLNRAPHTIRDSVLGAYPVGLLAHSHGWKKAESTPEKNVDSGWTRSDQAHVLHPREGLDFLCVADLGHWSMNRSVTPPPFSSKDYFGVAASEDHQRNGYSVSQPTLHNSEKASPVGTFIAELISRLSHADDALVPIDRGLAAAGVGREGGWGGTGRFWDLDQVLPDHVRNQLLQRGDLSGPAWMLLY
jgi:hypothetical protein